MDYSCDMEMSEMTQITDKEVPDGWRSVRIRKPLYKEVEKIVKLSKEFGIKKWDSRSCFVEEAILEKLKRIQNSKKLKEVKA